MSQEFKTSVSFHLSPQLRYTYKDKNGRKTEHVQNRILVISWFRNDGRMALRYSVNETGSVHDVRDVHNWALQASHDRELKKEQLRTLHELIPLLPKSTAAPPINRTVYVSLKDKKDWRTETYDATKLPKEFESVLKILGERFETRDRKKTQPK